MATQYEHYNVDNAATTIYGVRQRGQSFTPLAAHTITIVTLLLYKIDGGMGPGWAYVNIYATDLDGKPTGPSLAVGDLNAIFFTANPAGYNEAFDLGAGTPLTLGVKYALILTGTGPNNVNCIGQRLDESSPTYLRGNFLASNDAGVTWTNNVGADAWFEEWGDPLVVSAPIVTTDAASDIEPTTATLNGTLDDDGGEACDCGFEYGLDTSYGTTTPTQSKNTGETFEQAITGLLPNTTYHFRAIATNSGGTSYGSDQTFTTETATPEVTTDSATSVGQTTATLNGTLDDDGGEACDCGFEYGETTDYGSITSTQSKTAGETFSQEVRGLKSGTVYHFRAKATNSADTAYGADQIFHTEALSAEAHQALGRHFSMGRHGL